MASFALMPAAWSVESFSCSTSMSPFEVNAPPRCSRAQSGRGRPQQCTRSSARKSSSRSVGSRSSARSRRPSSEVDLRAPLPPASASSNEASQVTERATAFVTGVLNIAVDDIVTEMDYFSDACSLSRPDSPVFDAEHVLDVSEPPIAEESDDCEDQADFSTEAVIRVFPDMCSDSECDDEACSDFDDEVSVGSAEQDEMDDIFVAAQVAKQTTSTAVIKDALEFDDAADSEDARDEHIEFLGEEDACDDELAFNYASSILDVALLKATDTWAEQETAAKGQPPAGETSQDIQDMKEKARALLLQAATEQKKKDAATDSLQALKEKAQACLAKKAEEAQQKSTASQVEDMRTQAKTVILKSVENGMLSNALKVVQQMRLEQLRNQVQQTLFNATASGELERVLGEVMTQPKPQPSPGRLQRDADEDWRLSMRKVMLEAMQTGELRAALNEVTQKAEEKVQPLEVPAIQLLSFNNAKTEVTSSSRCATPTRTRRRVIGGVVRAPAMEQDLGVGPASRKNNGSKSKTLTTALRVDIGAADEDTAAGRSSSLARSYETMGVGAQFFSLADSDDLSFNTRSMSSMSGVKPKSSKARAKMHAASMSAMAMDLMDSQGGSSMPFCSSTSTCGTFAPAPLLDQKMRTSSSLGAISFSNKTKPVAAGLLPSLTMQKNSAESIAWSMNVSKTPWRNTGLHGSSSMIF